MELEVLRQKAQQYEQTLREKDEQITELTRKNMALQEENKKLGQKPADPTEHEKLQYLLQRLNAKSDENSKLQYRIIEQSNLVLANYALFRLRICRIDYI